MISVNYDIPLTEPHKQQIIDDIESILKYLPTWCHTLSVKYDFNNEDQLVAACIPSYTYRAMAFIIYPEYLAVVNKMEVLKHEILHGTLRPYVEKAELIINKVVQDETVHEILHNDLRNQEEAVIQDLVRFLTIAEENKNVN